LNLCRYGAAGVAICFCTVKWNPAGPRAKLLVNSADYP
jgi:hypothetical protein